MTGGMAVQKATFVVKGEFDHDAPHVGRMWEKGRHIFQTPGSNLRYKPAGSRRYVGGWFQSHFGNRRTRL